MEKTVFDQQIEKAQQRLDELERAAQLQQGEKTLLNEALAELSTLLVELGVSGEELSQQNEQLVEAREQLELERSHYKELFEFSPDGYLVTDANAVIQEANSVAAALLGVRQEFLIGKPLIVFIVEFEHEKFIDWLSQAGKSVRANLELTLQPRNGKPLPVELTVTAIRNRSKPVGLRWLIHDISQRKQVEAALRISEAEKALILDSTSDMIAYYDLDLRVLWANAASGASVGESPAALVGRHCYEIWHERDSACEGCPILVARDTRQPAEFEHRTPAGKIFHLRGYPVLDDAGEVKGIIEFSQDITRRKMAEEALQESEERFHTLAALAPIGIFLSDRQGDCTYANPFWLQLVGLTLEEALGDGWMNAIYSEDRQRVVVNWSQYCRNPQKWKEEYRLQTPQGQVTWVSGIAAPMINRHGELTGFVDIDVDINEYKMILEALRKSEAFLNNIVEQSPLAMWISDSEGTLIRINQACCELLNIREEDVLGVYNIHNDNLVEEQGYLPLVRNVFEQGEVVRFELTYDISKLQHPQLQKTANVILDITIFPIKNSSGKVTNAVIQNTNITERKRVEQALNDERNFINAILDNAAIVVNVLDREGHFVLVNKYYEQVTGYSANELEGRCIWDVTLPEDEAQVLKPYFEEIWGGDFPKVINNHVLTRAGVAVPFEWINTLIPDNNGKPRYSLGIGLGLTQRQKIEEQLRASLAEKEVLLREIHHRVKNNLEVVNSITAMQTRRIEDPVAKDSMRQLQERIRTISLVHESLYRSGNLAEIHAQRFLSKLTDNLLQAFGWSKLDLQVHVEDMIIPIDLAVPFGLIVTELVTNSIKHAFTNIMVDNALSGDGSKNVIRVTLSSQEGQNILEVGDNGVGFPEGLDWRNTSSLGLRLVNRLTEQLHGTLEIVNRGGTLFRLRFPG